MLAGRASWRASSSNQLDHVNGVLEKVGGAKKLQFSDSYKFLTKEFTGAQNFKFVPKFPKIRSFSPKFCIFGGKYFDKNFPDSPKFRGNRTPLAVAVDTKHVIIDETLKRSVLHATRASRDSLPAARYKRSEHLFRAWCQYTDCCCYRDLSNRPELTCLQIGLQAWHRPCSSIIIAKNRLHVSLAL